MKISMTMRMKLIFVLKKTTSILLMTLMCLTMFAITIDSKTYALEYAFIESSAFLENSKDVSNFMIILIEKKLKSMFLNVRMKH